MSLEFARHDMSKPCDSHAIIMRREMCEAVPSGAAVPGPVIEAKREEYVRQSSKITLVRCQEITLSQMRLIWTG